MVNNLGIFDVKPFEEIPDEDWFRFFEVNVMSGVRLSRHYLPGMKQRNRGRILFVSSESGVQIPAEMIHYGMTKTAQLAISRGLAETTAGTSVTVNTLLPGPTASEGANAFMDNLATQMKQTREQFEQEFCKSIRPSSLLKRFERPEEIGAMAAFLCSPLAWMAVWCARSSRVIREPPRDSIMRGRRRTVADRALYQGTASAVPKRTPRKAPLGAAPFATPPFARSSRSPHIKPSKTCSLE